MAITPRHYLDFINHYANLFHEKRSELEEQQMHLRGPRWGELARGCRRALRVSVALMWLLLLRWKSCVGTSG